MCLETIDRLEELDLPHPDFPLVREPCSHCEGRGYNWQRLRPHQPPVKLLCPRCFTTPRKSSEA